MYIDEGSNIRKSLEGEWGEREGAKCGSHNFSSPKGPLYYRLTKFGRCWWGGGGGGGRLFVCLLLLLLFLRRPHGFLA